MRALTWAVVTAWLCTVQPVLAVERLHIVIPAGPGGGLDGTAREAGRVLQALGISEVVSFENVPGGGGGRAMSQFVENEGRYRDALLVNSTPLIVRSLQGLFPHGFRDIAPISGLVADYGIFVVRADDPMQSWADLRDALQAEPQRITFGGGSVRGSLDHIVLALTLESMGVEPRRVRYLPYDGGGKAMLALLGAEVRVLSTGLGETIHFIEGGQVRVLAVTSHERMANIANVPNLTELGQDVVFANWRGAFAQRGISAERRAELIEGFEALKASPQWHDALAKRGWSTLAVSGSDFEAYLADQEKQLSATLRSLGFMR